MDTLLASLIFLASRQFWALSQILCRQNETLEVVKEKADNAFTCTYLPANILIWSLSITSVSPQIPIAHCEISQNECTMVGYPEIFSANMSATNSVINVNTVSLNPVNSFLFERGTLTCETRIISSVPGTKAECHLDYIYPAEGTCSIHFGSDTWLAKGHCIITKAASARNRYYCEWYVMQSSLEPKLVNTTSMIVSGNGTYVSGTCNFNGFLPEIDGQYKYTVILYPGKINASAIFNGSNEIRRPLGSINHNCTLYILEGQDIDCTCFTNDFGSPSGWLQWNNTDSARLILKNVTEKDSGKIYKCQMMWKYNSLNFTTFIINVVYGPRDILISANETIPFDTNGKRSISLLCNVSGTNPKPQITWSWSSNISAKFIGDTLTYKPNPPKDDGANIRCIAINEITNKSVTASVSVSLNYPPDTTPTISTIPALTTNSPFYLNDSVSMTCTIVGGKPISSTVVKFHCPNMSDVPDVYGSNHVNSTLQFDRISTGNQGLCQCSAQWKQYDWYTLQAEWPVVVYTPPSSPAITVPNNTIHQFPFLAGTSGRLQCKSDDPGYPTANYTWLEVSGGQANGGNLTFNNLTRYHDGTKVTCRASNDFTIKRRPVGDAQFVIHVYYPPVITFSSDISESSDVCSESSLKQWQCVVTEGHEVRIRCNAISNPSPATFIWNREIERNVSNSALMIILNADHNIHSGEVNCTVITSTENSDSRLPLFATKHMFMLVKYRPYDIVMNINYVTENLTVKEWESVTFFCKGNGRPTPTVRLLNKNNSTQMFNVQGGVLSLTDQMTTLNYTVPVVRCEDTGNYICSGENEIGSAQSVTTSLLINCAPRIIPDSSMPKEITFYGDPVPVIIEVIAYPKITEAYLKAIDNSSNMISSDVNMKFPLMCDESSLLYTSLCILVIKNATPADVGTYQMMLKNGIGELTIKIQIFVNIKDQCARCQENRNESLTPGASAGIALAVEAVVVALVMVILWRNGFIFNCRDKHADSFIKTISERAEWSNMKNNMNDMQVESSLDLPTMNSETGTNSQYEGLRVGEIGLAPAYESINQDTKCRAETGENIPSYEKLQTHDVGPVSHYGSIQQATNFNVIHSTGHVYANS